MENNMNNTTNNIASSNTGLSIAAPYNTKDDLKSYLIQNSDYQWGGKYEMPGIKAENINLQEINKLIPFSKPSRKHNINANDISDAWIHFYENDRVFECVWNNPNKYLDFFKQAKGIISPDYSTYYTMPLAYQIGNICRNRALGSWFQQNGIKVIPNVSFGTEESYEFCCDGIEPGGVIAVGALGTLRKETDKKYFAKGVNFAVNKLHPKAIIVYGTAHDKIFDPIMEAGVEVRFYESEIDKQHKK